MRLSVVKKAGIDHTLKGVCPVCHTHLDSVKPRINISGNYLLDGNDVIRFSPKLMEVFKCLFKRYPNPVAFYTIYDEIWGKKNHMSEYDLVSKSIDRIRELLVGSTLEVISNFNEGWSLRRK